VADVIFNVAKGREAHYGSLPATNDAIIAVPLEATGLVGDSTMIDYDTLAAVLAGASNEQTTMGRETLTGVAVTVDDTNDRVYIDADNPVWAAATGNATGALLFCYDPDTTASADANIIPISKHDFAATPAGGDITAQIDAGGLFRAS
jgi:hypothetical protein